LRADAVICIGASQVWGPPVEDNQPLDYASALAAIRSKVSPGIHVLYGEGVWSRPPTPQAAEPLSGRLDELVSLAELAELTIAHGFMPVAEASLDEWDEFESGFSARYASWLAEHGPQHPDAPEVHARAAHQQAAYFGGYRGVLGMALPRVAGRVVGAAVAVVHGPASKLLLRRFPTQTNGSRCQCRAADRFRRCYAPILRTTLRCLDSRAAAWGSRAIGCTARWVRTSQIVVNSGPTTTAINNGTPT
jgi:hypothetical protein